MTFQLDTSGFVDMKDRPVVRRWSDLSPFTQGYIEAMFADYARQCDEQADAYGQAVLRYPGLADLAPETLARIIADCEAMQAGGMVGTAEVGRIAWEARQQGSYAGFPPLAVALGDDGKVRFQ